MILVDTSVWIDHFRQDDPALRRLLEDARVVMHPFVRDEIALGSLRQRAIILSALDALPMARTAFAAEIAGFIEAHRLWRRGIGLVDVHLLASARLEPGMRLWSRDRRLRSVAEDLGVAAPFS